MSREENRGWSSGSASLNAVSRAFVFGAALQLALFGGSAHAVFDAPPGFDGFQLEPPYENKNPFLAAELQSIGRGFELFTTETFAGNGRVCSTCHLPERNYNITTDDIAALSPAEKAKVLGTVNPDLENAEIVEDLGLFNIDQHFGAASAGNIASPIGPFRASMSIGGLGLTSLNNYVCRPGQPTPAGTPCVNNNTIDDGIRDIMLGWSGDGSLVEMFEYTGAPVAAAADCEIPIEDFADELTDLEKSLATFSLAAVKTHFPLSQNRVPGVDFRCPTPNELIDMAMFQKWLGRRYELEIRDLEFASPIAQEGLALFSSRQAGCVGCHVNAGGSDTQGRVKLFPFPFLPEPDDNNFEHEPLQIIGANKTSRSGIQFHEPTLDAQVAANFPFDKGDHILRSGGTQGGFNVQSIIEATRKTRFFHNSVIQGSIEDAIAHYFTSQFDSSQGGTATRNAFRNRVLGPDVLAALGGQAAIDKIGYFLRHLSAVYSLADCERFADEMIDRTNLGLSTDLPFTHCQFALGDAAFVIEGSQVAVPTTQARILAEIAALQAQLEDAENISDPDAKVAALNALINALSRTRTGIADTQELPGQTTAAPAAGTAATAALALCLLAAGIRATRRRSRRD